MTILEISDSKNFNSISEQVLCMHEAWDSLELFKINRLALSPNVKMLFNRVLRDGVEPISSSSFMELYKCLPMRDKYLRGGLAVSERANGSDSEKGYYNDDFKDAITIMGIHNTCQLMAVLKVITEL